MCTGMLIRRCSSTETPHSSWGNNLEWQVRGWKILAFIGRYCVCAFEEHHLEQQSTCCGNGPSPGGEMTNRSCPCVIFNEPVQSVQSVSQCLWRQRSHSQRKKLRLLLFSPSVNDSVIKYFCLLLSSSLADIFATIAFSFPFVSPSETEQRHSLAED